MKTSASTTNHWFKSVQTFVSVYASYRESAVKNGFETVCCVASSETVSSASADGNRRAAESRKRFNFDSISVLLVCLYGRLVIGSGKIKIK